MPFRDGLRCAGGVVIRLETVTADPDGNSETTIDIAQKGGVAALTGPQDHLPIWLAEFDKRRQFAFEKLNAMPGVTCVKAKGAFYLFPNIAATGMKSAEFCEKLLAEEKVAAVPGSAFGADDYVRLSYAMGLDTIEKGLERVDRFCRKLAS